MPPLLLHIPHSSSHIPFYNGFVVEKKVIEKEILKLTDWYTLDLFGTKKDEILAAYFSRVFCDVERFSDDPLEVMSNYGMGVLYDKTDDGKTMRVV